ncbi:segregation and condensation protein B [Alkalithermobacter thermoalcaliphilus JW-YL-7 = DSM 7308]|uniref:Segregation and condensation protein B n=1 Tax=Alkalithermobacter thermoalcaliphilus JW-YL-7 = DSM 7308 TaxID=1121328 RepID=A0A150FQM5_CLOPD|nr:chromosome segregation and condensation protein, ScpB [[Clostridium] paradoxum JW-YL-7 = DSM 7308]SHK77373.1 segregation and condensation protein B [[Clostridium] paradoxum JW-YL-7 = DSM 7308]
MNIRNIIESILFAFADPISPKDIKNILNDDITISDIRKEIEFLMKEYKKNNRGIQIIRLDDKYQMCTNKEYESYIKKILQPKKKKTLTQAALETLAIIAYKQPITKVEIEDIRGVKSDKAINTLIENNLIKEAGRLDKIGKPILYKTTDEFLKVFGLQSLKDLPELESFKEEEKEAY